jgi:hypothetical protein
MSDLTGKFTTLEAQLSSQHTEVINGLNSILAALGAPPSGPVTTLDDVITAIGQTNSLLTAIHTDMNSYLLGIFNTLDTMNNNASLNAQRLFTFLLQTTCPCDTTVPLLPPDLSTTPISATDAAKCQRIQYFIDLFRSWVITTAVFIGDNGSISSYEINVLLASTLADVSITTGQLYGGMPTTTRDGIISLITQAIATLGASAVNGGLFDAINDTANLNAMRQALYGADNASAGRTALIDALEPLISEPFFGIIVSMFYSAWPNDIYSDVPAVDASGYDGTICAPASECITLDSSGISFTPPGEPPTQQGIIWPSSFETAANTAPGQSFVASANVFLIGNWAGGTLVTDTTATTVYVIMGGDTPNNALVPGVTYTLPTTAFVRISSGNTTPFTVTFCPPLL